MENSKSFVLIPKETIEKTSVYSGNCELIDSRVVIAYDSESPFEIEEVFNTNFKILIRIVLVNDDTGEHGIRFNVNAETNTIEYQCKNFDNALGTGTSKPIEIGTFSGKKIYIHFWIYAMGGNASISRKLEYAIWKER